MITLHLFFKMLSSKVRVRNRKRARTELSFLNQTGPKLNIFLGYAIQIKVYNSCKCIYFLIFVFVFLDFGWWRWLLDSPKNLLLHVQRGMPVMAFLLAWAAATEPRTLLLWLRKLRMTRPEIGSESEVKKANPALWSRITEALWTFLWQNWWDQKLNSYWFLIEMASPAWWKVRAWWFPPLLYLIFHISTSLPRS